MAVNIHNIIAKLYYYNADLNVYILYTLQNFNHYCLITRTRTTICMVPQADEVVEQVEKSFLSNEGGCRDVIS